MGAIQTTGPEPLANRQTKQTQAFIPLRSAHGHLGFDFSQPIAWRVEVRDPVHHILDARMSSGLNRTEKKKQHNGGAVPTSSP